MSNKGFILPTVLGFIIISSLYIIVQGSYVVNSYYAFVKMEKVMQLTSIGERMRYVISNNEFGNSCHYQNYEQFNLEKINYRISGSCLVTATDDIDLNKYLNELVNRKVPISNKQYTQVINYLNSLEITVNGESAEIITPKSQTTVKIADRYQLYDLEIDIDDQYNAFIITDEYSQEIINIIGVDQVQ